MKKNKIPRGIRNRNPLNIERNASRWKGMRKVQTDPRFVQFEELQWGIRAAFIILNNYYYKHGCRTLRQFISRWCPPAERGNNTENYIQFVALKADILPDDELPAPDKEQIIWATIVNKMILVECGGHWLNYAIIDAGWSLAFE